MSRKLGTILTALLCALSVACAPGGAPDGPGQAVQQFYRHLNDEAYNDARRLYNAEALAVVGNPEVTSDAAFGSWAQAETKSGIISEVEIVASTVDESTASVEFEIVYDDGSREKRSVELTQEDGQWRLGFIS